MEIEYGALVRDKNGRILGNVNRVLRDTWTGDIRKFSVSTELADTDLFYSTEEVVEANDKEIKLGIAFGEANSLEIQFGARVTDNSGREIGTVDYPVSDILTGEITKFKVKTDTSENDVFFSLEDVAETTPSEVKLKIAFKKSGHGK